VCRDEAIECVLSTGKVGKGKTVFYGNLKSLLLLLLLFISFYSLNQGISTSVRRGGGTSSLRTSPSCCLREERRKERKGQQRERLAKMREKTYLLHRESDLGAGTETLAVEDEEPGDGGENKGEETEEGGSPGETELVVHHDAEEGL
jgi:hypothetical protein